MSLTLRVFLKAFSLSQKPDDSGVMWLFFFFLSKKIFETLSRFCDKIVVTGSKRTCFLHWLVPRCLRSSLKSLKMAYSWNMWSIGWATETWFHSETLNRASKEMLAGLSDICNILLSVTHTFMLLSWMSWAQRVHVQD